MARDAAKPSRSKDLRLRVRLCRAAFLSLALATPAGPALAQDAEAEAASQPQLQTADELQARVPSVIVNLGVLESLGPVQNSPAATGATGLKSAALLPPPPSPPKSRLLGQYAAVAPIAATAGSAGNEAAVTESAAPTQSTGKSKTAKADAPASADQLAEVVPKQKPAKDKTAKAARKQDEKIAKAPVVAPVAESSAVPVADLTPDAEEPAQTAADMASAEADVPQQAAEAETEAPVPVPPPPPPADETATGKPKEADQAADNKDADDTAPAVPTEIQTAAVAPKAEVEATEPVAPPLETQAPKSLPDIAALQVLFSPGSAQLSPEEEASLKDLAAQLAAVPDLRVQLLAYASETNATANTARRLSLSRALAVRDLLIEQGIATARVQVRALGPAEDGPPNRVDIKPQGS